MCLLSANMHIMLSTSLFAAYDLPKIALIWKSQMSYDMLQSTGLDTFSLYPAPLQMLFSEKYSTSFVSSIFFDGLKCWWQ
jgi:hypothetical protein